jgi:flagellar export protein FliJ
MSTKVHRLDRGPTAVRRVRDVREQDSRLGLQHALAEEAALLGRLDSYEGRLATTEPATSGSCAELVRQRTALGMLALLIADTRERAATSTALVSDARARWAADKSRLEAVEHLLERRAQERAAEAARRTAAELDDLAAQRWQRRTQEESA